MVAVLQLATLREQDQQAGWYRWSCSIAARRLSEEQTGMADGADDLLTTI